MNAEMQLIELVRQIIEAENEGGEGGRSKADLVLAPNFAKITRSSGEEQGRDDLLKAIGSAGETNPLRRSVEGEFWTSQSNSAGVVRSLVTTHKRSDPSITLGRFRNTHVFEKQDGAWRCVAWQVTRLKESEAFIGPDDDYKIKLDYLKSQFERSLTRFNLLLTIEVALFGFVGWLLFERINVEAVRVPALLGVFVSAIWYIAAAEDHALASEYRGRVQKSADRLGVFAKDHPAMEVETRWDGLLSWYWRPLSVTSLPVVIALATLFLWVLVLAFGPAWLDSYTRNS